METSKKIKLLDFKLTKSLWSSLFWMYKSTFKWSWIDFVEHKEYVYWDSIKNIDWKLSSRTDKVYTKIFEEERDLNVLILIDISDSMFFWSEEKRKIDTLEEIFFSIAFSAYQNNDSVWAYIYDEKSYEFLSYKRWVWNIFNILEKIKNKNLKNKTNTDKKTLHILEKINKFKIKNSLIFILSDDTNLYDERLLKNISQNNQLIFINIFDYFENNLDFQNSNLSMNLKNDFLNIDLKNKEKIRSYKSIREKSIKNLKNMLEKNNIWYLMIDSKKDPYKELYSYFSKFA